MAVGTILRYLFLDVFLPICFLINQRDLIWCSCEYLSFNYIFFCKVRYYKKIPVDGNYKRLQAKLSRIGKIRLSRRCFVLQTKNKISQLKNKVKISFLCFAEKNNLCWLQKNPTVLFTEISDSLEYYSTQLCLNDQTVALKIRILSFLCKRF